MTALRRYATVERQMVQDAAQSFYGGDPEQAARQFSFIAAAHPDDPAIHFNLAVCLAESGNPVLARLAFDQAVRLNPKLDSSLATRDLIIH